METGKHHATILYVIKVLTVLCSALIFPINIARAFNWYGLELGVWEAPVLLTVYALAWKISWVIIERASVGVVEAPAQPQSAEC